MDDELPDVPEETIESYVASSRERTELKSRRVNEGLDPAITLRDPLPANATLAEREQRWGFTLDELRIATKVVKILFENPHLYVGDEYLAESRLYTMISRDRKAKKSNLEVLREITREERARRHKDNQQADLKALQRTKMKQERDAALVRLLLPQEEEVDQSATPESEGLDLRKARKCHICKEPFQSLHHFYYSLCPSCAEFNYLKRTQRRDLSGKTVLLTGCRIKIGYEIALSLLRCGATLIGTTRFSCDAVKRFSSEADYEDWKDRLHVFSLDLRDLRVVTEFCEFLSTRFNSLFAILNNAAQTIARTAKYTEPLRVGETIDFQSTIPKLSPCARDWNSAAKRPAIPAEVAALLTDATKGDSGVQVHDFDRYDSKFELSDHRSSNSWTQNLGEISGTEATEVMAINALAPFIINSKLKPLLMAESDPPTKRFIINVSAMEGQFYRYKSTAHPHTNMAKAALNMMTRTSGADYAKDGIYMNSVDTGWITDESPVETKIRRGDGFLQCPLDEVDAAARCLDLIYTDSEEFGKFWKDYKPIPW